MKKKFFTLLTFPLFSIAVVFTSSCSPIGGLLHGSAALDYIRAAPIRSLYDMQHWFKPAEDVEVFGVFGGVEDPNPIDVIKLEIKIINDPGLVTEKEISVDNLAGYLLLSKGVKTVVISYNNMKTSYPIVVGEQGTSGWVEQDGSGTGIQIIWN